MAKNETRPILSTHDWFDQSMPDALKARDFYLGGRHVLRTDGVSKLRWAKDLWGQDTLSRGLYAKSPYLLQHAEEDDTIYAQRCAALTYENYIEAPLKIYSSAIWSGRRIKRIMADGRETTQVPIIQSFLDDCDGKGHSIDDVMAEAWTWAAVEDVAYIIADLPRMPEHLRGQQLSLADVIEAGLFPRLSVIRKADLYNWALDEDGRPTEILHWVCGGTTGSILNGSSSERHLVKYWTTTNWQLIDPKTGDIIDQDEHGLGVIPIYEVIPIEGEKPWQGLSLLRDVVPLAQEILNLDSEHREFLKYSALSTMAVQAHEDADLEKVRIGHSRFLRVPPEVTTMPQILTPDQTPAQSYVTAIVKKVERIYRLLNIRLQSQTGRADGASAESKDADEMVTARALAKNASVMERVENYIHWVCALWMTGGDQEQAEAEQCTATYPKEKDFARESVSIELDALTKYEGLEYAPPQIKAAAALNVGERLAPQIDDESLDAAKEWQAERIASAALSEVMSDVDASLDQDTEPNPDAEPDQQAA